MIVDVHTHFVPRFLYVGAPRFERFFGVGAENGWLIHPQGFQYQVSQREWFDADAKVATASSVGINVSLLSLSPTLFFYDEEEQQAIEFARRANDDLARLVSGTPSLGGLATLPLQAPEAAAAELERAVRELGFVGAQIGTRVDDARPLSWAELEPLWATAETLGAPLMLHPSYVGPKRQLEDFYFVNTIGNPLETCLGAATMIHAGILERFPGLRIVLVHGGGYLPYQLGRFDHAFEVRPEPQALISRPPSTFIDQIWFDSLTHSDAALEFLVALVGTEHLLLGTDLPADMGDSRPIERLERTGTSATALGDTAARLFGLPFVECMAGATADDCMSRSRPERRTSA